MLPSQADNNLLVQVFASIDYSNFTDVNEYHKVYGVYIGLASPIQSTDRSNWVWLITGKTPNWNGWALMQPDNGGGGQGLCGILSIKPVNFWDRQFTGMWYDGSCEDALPFVCELGKMDCHWLCLMLLPKSSL